MTELRDKKSKNIIYYFLRIAKNLLYLIYQNERAFIEIVLLTLKVQKMKDLIIRVMDIAQKNPNGFTLNLKTMRLVRYGIPVAYLETQNSFGNESLEKVIDHALKHNSIIGGWLDEQTNLYYFDSVKLFKESDLNKAIEFAKENKQIAIFNIRTLTEIRIEG